ncbi:hypothetical protein ACFQ1L_40725 [Phytohabitans flavus]|uniref:hypothetical protein n=1 Tax=Phytohabitans flavus TaxID=1076124 RepID=UPI0015678BE2|nr:hypothetical protein [Phytohabitans flavus]
MEIYADAVVILDTNQWDRMPMLRHGLAASLLFALRRNNLTLLLPDIVRHEVQLHLVENTKLRTRRSVKGSAKFAKS